ncbi:MAG: hypothetical protein IPM76_20625 [Chloroflexi bacterium]|nr:hypothetical protein [Chloroflexota bacterium]
MTGVAAVYFGGASDRETFLLTIPWHMPIALVILHGWQLIAPTAAD